VKENLQKLGLSYYLCLHKMTDPDLGHNWNSHSIHDFFDHLRVTLDNKINVDTETRRIVIPCEQHHLKAA